MTISPYKGGAGGGFTLIELVIVVLVLGIAIMLAAPLLTASVNDARLSSAVSATRVAFAYARLSAMGAGQVCRVKLDTANSVLTVEQLVWTNLNQILNESLSTVPEVQVDSNTQYGVMKDPLAPDALYRIDFLADTRFAGATLVSSLTDGSQEVVFDEFGGPSTGGTVAVGYGGRSATLTIQPLTGTVVLN